MLRVQSLNKDLMSGVILVYPGTKFWVREGENGQDDGVLALNSDVMLHNT